MRRILLGGLVAAGLIVATVVFLPTSGEVRVAARRTLPASTPPPTPTPRPLVIAAAGDIACAASVQRGSDRSCRDRATAELVGSISPDAVLVLGDTQYEIGALTDFARAYEATWGRFKAITYPSVGNHEYATDEAAGYFDYFGGRAGGRGNGFYSFDLGTWHVIALNSNCAIVGCIEDSLQARWLRADVAAHPTRCTLAFAHHPLFSSGVHRGEFALTHVWDVLDEAGADVFLAGHDHLYERFRPMDAGGSEASDGIRQFVVGTGGHGLHEFTSAQPGSEVRFNRDFGVLKLTLFESSYAWEFLSLGGSVDSGRGDCV